MKKLMSLIVVVLMNIAYVQAQFKDYPKLTGLFDAARYKDCIDNSQKIIEKEPKEIKPVLYCSRSYFELFKSAGEKDKLNHLKNCLRFASKIEKLDKKNEATDEYSDFLKDLHTATLDFAGNLYSGPQKDKSKTFFESLARVFKDTTAQFYEFNPNLVKKPVNEVGINTEAKAFNEVDSKGLKQGFWSKVYPNGSKAYEVYFRNDKPIGEYKRYHENGKLSAFLNYDNKGEWADAKFYDEEGKLIAIGKYHYKLKHGNWTYYKDSLKILEDNYKEGKRDGVAKAYYENGKVSDERNFVNDVENGVWRQYYESGKIRLETRIDSGVRNSVYYVYYETGKLEIRGKYKKDHMDGEWIYYDTDGKEKERIKYVMGKSEKEAELEKNENEFFKEIEKNKDRFLDPADYIHNPDEYLRKNGLKQ